MSPRPSASRPAREGADGPSVAAAAAPPPRAPDAPAREVDAAPRRAAAEWVPIDSLRPWDQNPRKRRPVAEVSDSIRELGWGAVIVARRDGTIVAGHTRWEAAKHLGHAEVPVRFVDLDARQAALLALADNKLGELAAWDDDALAALLGPLMLEHAEAAAVAGFSDAEIAALLRRTADDVLAAGAEAEPAEASPRCEAVVTCADAAARGRLLARLLAEGYACRALD